MADMDILYPVENAFRHHLDLSGYWYVALEKGNASGWENKIPRDFILPIPSSFNEFFFGEEGEFCGNIWYERSIFIRKEWMGEEVYLRIDQALYRSKVYINGIEAGKQEMGYMPAVFDITRHIRYGEENTITIVVNNELSDRTLPLGTVTEDEFGKKTLHPNRNIYPYSGLMGKVHIFSKPDMGIVDLAVETVMATQDRAELHYVAVVRGNCLVTATLREQSGRIVATAVGGNATLMVEQPHLWSLGDGYQYTLELEVSRLGKKIDAYSQQVGLRTFSVREGRFYLNGEEIYLKGVMWKHGLESGRGVADIASLTKDVKFLKHIGGVVVSSGACPFDERLLDVLDREGILAIQELPVANLLTEEYTFGLDELASLHEELGKSMVRRDKNRASVIMWSAGEELQLTEEYVPKLEKVMAEMKRYDLQSRPVFYTWDGKRGPEEENGAGLCDVLALHGAHFGREEEIEKMLAQKIQAWAKAYPDKAIILASYGESVVGSESMRMVKGSPFYQRKCFRAYHGLFDRLSMVQGEIVWNYIDYVPYDGGEGGCKYGGILNSLHEPTGIVETIKDRWLRGRKKSDLMMTAFRVNGRE